MFPGILLLQVADLLGVEVGQLYKVLQRPATPKTGTPVSSMASSMASSLAPSSTSSRASSPGIGESLSSAPVLQDGLVVDNVRRLALNLYSDLLSRLVAIINRCVGRIV